MTEKILSQDEVTAAIESLQLQARSLTAQLANRGETVEPLALDPTDIILSHERLQAHVASLQTRAAAPKPAAAKPAAVQPKPAPARRAPRLYQTERPSQFGATGESVAAERSASDDTLGRAVAAHKAQQRQDHAEGMARAKVARKEGRSVSDQARAYKGLPLSEPE